MRVGRSTTAVVGSSASAHLLRVLSGYGARTFTRLAAAQQPRSSARSTWSERTLLDAVVGLLRRRPQPFRELGFPHLRENLSVSQWDLRESQTRRSDDPYQESPDELAHEIIESCTRHLALQPAPAGPSHPHPVRIGISRGRFVTGSHLSPHEDAVAGAMSDL